MEEIDLPEPDLPDRRWATVEIEQDDSPEFDGYEAWVNCACGALMTRESVSQGTHLDCDKCGRAYIARFEQVDGASIKHPVCPDCHEPMTARGGYTCPECEVSIPRRFIDNYNDALREFQIELWLDELRCGQSTDWHIHSSTTRDAELHHCARCCPNCTCDCQPADTPGEGLPRCTCEHDGESTDIARSHTHGRREIYGMARRSLDVDGRFPVPAEERARRAEVYDALVERLQEEDIPFDDPFAPDDNE